MKGGGGELNSVTGSGNESSSCGKELYFKVIGYINSETWGSILFPNKVIINNRLISNAYIGYSSISEHIGLFEILNECIAFSVPAEEISILQFDRNYQNPKYTIIPSGNSLIEKVLGGFLKQLEEDFERPLTKEEVEQYTNQVVAMFSELMKDSFVEITKEEFESYITE